MGISEKMGDVLGQAVEAKLFREVMEHDIQPKHLAIIMDGIDGLLGDQTLPHTSAIESESNVLKQSLIGFLNLEFLGLLSMLCPLKI